MTDRLTLTRAFTPRKCDRCGGRFSPRPRGRPQRFCSVVCRQAAYLERQRLKIWLGSLNIVTGGLLFAALHYWPPHSSL